MPGSELTRDDTIKAVVRMYKKLLDLLSGHDQDDTTRATRR